MRFNGQLEKGFVLGKPIAQEGYEPEVLDALEREGRLIITRKRDGYKMLAASNDAGEFRLYTDGINEIDDRLAHIKHELNSLELKNAWLAGEVIMDLDDSDDFTKVASVMKAGMAKAIELQLRHGSLRFMVFNIIARNGKACTTNYADNLAALAEVLERKAAMYGTSAIAVEKTPHVFLVPVLNMPLSDAQSLVRKKGWEGLVLYADDFVNTFRTDGKDPQRPKGCYKWKPIFEDDFIVREKILRPGGDEVKELVLLQIDPATRAEFECGKLGSFSAAMRKQLAKAKYPLVVQAKFEARYPKSGKIRNARFMRLRTDKAWKDCIAPQSYASGV